MTQKAWAAYAAGSHLARRAAAIGSAWSLSSAVHAIVGSVSDTWHVDASNRTSNLAGPPVGVDARSNPRRRRMGWTRCVRAASEVRPLQADGSRLVPFDDLLLVDLGQGGAASLLCFQLL